MKLSANQSKNHMVDILFILALFCVLAASSLMVVMIGANVYKSTVEQANENFSMSTSLSYVSEKMRQNDFADGISLGEIEGVPALVLKQQIGENVYETIIYHNDGYLKELFIPSYGDASLENGQILVEIDDFIIEEGDGFFRFTSIDDGDSREMVVSPRCK